MSVTFLSFFYSVVLCVYWKIICNDKKTIFLIKLRSKWNEAMQKINKIKAKNETKEKMKEKIRLIESSSRKGKTREGNVWLLISEWRWLWKSQRDNKPTILIKLMWVTVSSLLNELHSLRRMLRIDRSIHSIYTCLAVLFGQGQGRREK